MIIKAIKMFNISNKELTEKNYLGQQIKTASIAGCFYCPRQLKVSTNQIS